MDQKATEQQVVEFLRDLPAGRLPLEVFFQIARILVTTVVEIVPVRLRNGVVEVLFLERDKADPNWGGLLHTPGTIVFSTDEEGGLTSAFNRILQKELKETPTLSHPVYVDIMNHQVKRGREIALIHWVEMPDSDPVIGEYHPINKLPERVVDTQIEFIKQAVTHFVQSKSN